MKKTQSAKFESLKSLGYRIITKHYYESIPLIDVLSELLQTIKNDQSILILHYHDQVLDAKRLFTLMETVNKNRYSIISAPPNINKPNSAHEEYTLSGTIVHSSVIVQYLEKIKTRSTVTNVNIYYG